MIVCHALSSMWYLKVFKPLLEHIVHTINTSLMVLPQQIAAYFSVIVKIFEHPVNMLPVLVHFTSFHGAVLCPKKCPLQDNCSYTCMHLDPENYFKKTCI